MSQIFRSSFAGGQGNDFKLVVSTINENLNIENVYNYIHCMMFDVLVLNWQYIDDR